MKMSDIIVFSVFSCRENTPVTMHPDNQEERTVSNYITSAFLYFVAVPTFCKQ